MQQKEQKTTSAHGMEETTQEGKSMAPPKFSLHASAAGDPAGNGLDGFKSADGKSGHQETGDNGPVFVGSFVDSLLGMGIGTALGGIAGGMIGGAFGAFMGNENEEETASEESPIPVCVAPPKLEYATLLDAPDGSGKVRTNVGVGETVVFKSDQSGEWSASEGTPGSQSKGKSFVWKAPNHACNPVIKIKAGSSESIVTMEVIEPQLITTSKIDEIAYPAGVAGAGMHLYFDYHPMSVSFGNIEAGERSGPASSISGYFSAFPADALKHDSGDHFTRVNAKNRDTAPDQAAASGLEEPWSDGSFHWMIPNRFRLAGEGGEGKDFYTVDQGFSIKADGEVTVSKEATSVTRKP